jgi:hypothetical protein
MIGARFHPLAPLISGLTKGKDRPLLLPLLLPLLD